MKKLKYLVELGNTSPIRIIKNNYWCFEKTKYSVINKK